MSRAKTAIEPTVASHNLFHCSIIDHGQRSAFHVHLKLVDRCNTVAVFISSYYLQTLNVTPERQDMRVDRICPIPVRELANPLVCNYLKMGRGGGGGGLYDTFFKICTGLLGHIECEYIL